jgi:D-glycero-D-manno-heptose 1,7-bisphosphate phosphatase
MTNTLRPAIFLDRDGVLIETTVRDGKPFAITPGEAVTVIAGVPQACAALARAGFVLVMTTNQPDVARGKVPAAFVEGVNARLATELSLDDVEVCTHDDSDLCPCRKPRPGLMLQAANRLHLDLASSYVVGDRWRDVDAGIAAGCRTVFIDYGYREALRGRPDFTCKSLGEAVPWILSHPLLAENES